jgi:hypothetical protein
MFDELRIPIQSSLQPALIICVPASSLADRPVLKERYAALPKELARVVETHSEPIDVHVYDEGQCPAQGPGMREWLLAHAATLGNGARFLAVVTKDVNRPPRSGLWSVIAMALRIARELRGTILDPEAARSISSNPPRAFFPSTGRIHVAQHISVFFSEAGRDRGWMTTKGMSKFGLPELEVRDMPSYTSNFAPVLNACAQRLVELTFNAVAQNAMVRHLALPARLQIDRALVGRANGLPFSTDLDDTAEVGLRFPSGKLPDQRMIQIGPPNGDRRDLEEWVLSVGDQLLARRTAS